jgi:hypothetical protein
MQNRMNNPARPIHSRRTMKAFLSSCWKAHQNYPNAYVCVASFDRGAARMRHYFIRMQNQSRELRSVLSALSQSENDIYFCANALRSQSLKKGNVLATPYLHADIDDAVPDAFKPRPNILWETSPGRFQGLWSMKTAIDADLAQKNSKRLAYTYGADKNGHAPNKLLRVPGSVNMKPEYNRPVVEVIRDNWLQKYSKQDLELDLVPPSQDPDISPIPRSKPTDQAQVRSIWRKYQPVLYKSDIGKCAGVFMKHRSVHKTTDRSGTIYCIIVGLHCVGATRTEIAIVLIANPYFRSKYGTSHTKLEQEISRCISNWEASHG